MNDLSYRITGLAPELFSDLYGLSDADLARRGATRMQVDECPGYPDRVAMRDCEVGETVLLLNYEHLQGPGPYRSSHAIFVREGELERFDVTDCVPEVMRRRQLSVRAFDQSDMMVDAAIVDGSEAEGVFRRMLATDGVVYLHVHNAERGCFSGRVERSKTV